MNRPEKNRLKRIGVDVLGVLAIIAAGLTGWLPGPGGIPLLILGLSLLATNHEWAERLLMTVKQHGVHISNKLFDNPRINWLVDLVSVAFIAVAVFLLTSLTRSLAKAAAVSLIIVGLFLFFGNRKRFQSFKNKLTKHKN